MAAYMQRSASFPAPGAMQRRMAVQAARVSYSSAPFSAAPPRRQSRHGRKQVVVRANWGAPVEFKSAKLQGQPKEVAPNLFQLVVDVGSDLSSGYTKPGQYLQAKVQADAKPGFFAIASAPAAHGPALEFLIKRAAPGSTAEALVQLGSGAEVLVSPVQGKGFPVQNIPASDVQTVLLFATGSGISPIKAVIESGVLEAGKRKEVRLYYGTKDEGTTAYQQLIPQWEAAGVKVTQVFSGNNKAYVQQQLEKDLAAGKYADASSLGVLLCGQKDMAVAVTEMLTGKGVPKERILSNF